MYFYIMEKEESVKKFNLFFVTDVLQQEENREEKYTVYMSTGQVLINYPILLNFSMITCYLQV